MKIRVIAAPKVLDLAFFENPEASDSQLMVRLPHRSVAGGVQGLPLCSPKLPGFPPKRVAFLADRR